VVPGSPPHAAAPRASTAAAAVIHRCPRASPFVLASLESLVAIGASSSRAPSGAVRIEIDALPEWQGDDQPRKQEMETT
jgi:hypothetical protein